MFGITSSGKLFSDELTNSIIYEAGFNQSLCQMSIYCKYEIYGSRFVVLSYVYDCVYWYTSEELGKCFFNKLVNRLHVKNLGYAHLFMFISISKLKDHYI